MSYQEIITIKEWVDGSGWSYEQVYNRAMVDEIPSTLEVGDVWDGDTSEDGGDTRITVTYYADEDEDREAPIREFSFWASEAAEEA